MSASTARHETRALLRAHLAAASGYRHLTRHCPICHRLLRLALEPAAAPRAPGTFLGPSDPSRHPESPEAPGSLPAAPDSDPAAPDGPRGPGRAQERNDGLKEERGEERYEEERYEEPSQEPSQGPSEDESPATT